MLCRLYLLRTFVSTLVASYALVIGMLLFRITNNHRGRPANIRMLPFRYLWIDCQNASALRASLFPDYVVPYIYFRSWQEPCRAELPKELENYTGFETTISDHSPTWKIVSNSGLKLLHITRDEEGFARDDMPWYFRFNAYPWQSGLQRDRYVFIIPGIDFLCNKHTLYSALRKMKYLYPEDYDGFIPQTFHLNSRKDVKALHHAFEREGTKARFVVKSADGSLGRNIKIVAKWEDFVNVSDIRRACYEKDEDRCGPDTKIIWHIVQEYKQTHCIDRRKYDLRLYLHLKSINPLKMFLFDDGLVRFSSREFTMVEKSLGDVSIHLTNTNVQSRFVQRKEEMIKSIKWLRNYFKERLKTDWSVIWERIKDIIIKTVIAGERTIAGTVNKEIPSNYRGGALIGVDVILDAEYRPWLIEFNRMPTVHPKTTTIDQPIKRSFLQEFLNIEGVHFPCRFSNEEEKMVLGKIKSSFEDHKRLCIDHQFYTRPLSRKEKIKRRQFTDGSKTRDERLDEILVNLTRDDIHHLIRYEDEMSQAVHFEPIFPTRETYKYLHFLQVDRYVNFLLDAWVTKYDRRERIKIIRRWLDEKAGTED